MSPDSCIILAFKESDVFQIHEKFNRIALAVVCEELYPSTVPHKQFAFLM